MVELLRSKFKRSKRKFTFMSAPFEYVVYVNIDHRALCRHILTMSFMSTFKILAMSTL